MKKVFCGGSRRLGRLNKEIKNRLDNILGRKFIILVGDANGADRAIQEYVAGNNYHFVKVFCAGSRCRNNIAKWETKFIAPENHVKGFQLYAFRDKKMCNEADYGFMLWDGKSKGTLNNLLNLLEKNKNSLVYFSPKKKFFKIKSYSDLNELLKFCSKDAIRIFDMEIKLSQRINNKQIDFNLSSRNNSDSIYSPPPNDNGFADTDT